jgi:DNA polymerase III alpha subunit
VKSQIAEYQSMMAEDQDFKRYVSFEIGLEEAITNLSKHAASVVLPPNILDLVSAVGAKINAFKAKGSRSIA